MSVRVVESNKKHDVVLSSELFDLVYREDIGRNNTPWTGLEVISKGKANELIVYINLDIKEFVRFNGDPVRYEYKDATINYGLKGTRTTDEDIRDLINVFEEALDFKSKILDYINNVYSKGE